MDNLTRLSRINFHPATASVHSGAALQVELILQCLMPMPVCIQQLAASIHFALEQVGTNGRSKAAQRQAGAGTVEFPQRSSSAGPSSSAPYVSLELEEIQDRSPTDNSLNSTGVVCKNTHLVIRRHDSSSPPDTPSILSPAAVTMKEGGQMLEVHDVTLQPGNNSIMFTAPVSESISNVGNKPVSYSKVIVFNYNFPVLFSYFKTFSVFRVGSQAFTCCVSYMHQWAMYSLCCLIFTHLSSMKSILRSLNSPWNLSQVGIIFNVCLFEPMKLHINLTLMCLKLLSWVQL